MTARTIARRQETGPMNRSKFETWLTGFCAGRGRDGDQRGPYIAPASTTSTMAGGLQTNTTPSHEAARHQRASARSHTANVIAAASRTLNCPVLALPARGSWTSNVPIPKRNPARDVEAKRESRRSARANRARETIRQVASPSFAGNKAKGEKRMAACGK